jgi:hypothetical protein
VCDAAAREASAKYDEWIDDDLLAIDCARRALDSPAGEELQSVVGRGVGLGGAGGEGESFVGFQGHGLEHQVKGPDGGMTEVLYAGAVQPDVVGGRVEKPEPGEVDGPGGAGERG